MAGTMLAGLGITAGMMAGCGGPGARAQQQLGEAQLAAAAGHYSRAEQLVDPVIRAHGGRKELAAAYYVRSQCRIRAGQRDAARQDLDMALRLKPDADLRAQIEAQLGNLAFDEDAYPTASLMYARAVGRLPHLPPTDRIMLQYGVALQRSGQFDAARRVYAELIHDFRGSPHAGTAAVKQSWGENYFAIQCGAFSRPSSAQELVGALRARGLNAEISTEVRGSSRLSVVRVGRFPTYADAARLLARVRGVASDAFIVP